MFDELNRLLGDAGLVDYEPLDTSEPYCGYCEMHGHTFRQCARRDDSIERIDG